jgi:hypothetical protein
MAPPQNLTFSPVVEAQAAVKTLLLAYEPTFITFGEHMFEALAIILLVWHGVRMMFTTNDLSDKVFDFAKVLLILSFGYAMVHYYERPIPGVGVSFSNLITDQATYFANVIDLHALKNFEANLDDLFSRFEKPDAWSILATLLYLTVMIVVSFTKCVALAVVCFGLIASAVCALLGPIFLPFFIVPTLEWLFWSWLKAFIAYSFMQVVAYAFIFVFQKFLFAYLTTLPLFISQNNYVTYVVQVLMILLTFPFGVFLVPSLTASIFSGHSGESVVSAPTMSGLARLAKG